MPGAFTLMSGVMAMLSAPQQHGQVPRVQLNVRRPLRPLHQILPARGEVQQEGMVVLRDYLIRDPYRQPPPLPCSGRASGGSPH